VRSMRSLREDDWEGYTADRRSSRALVHSRRGHPVVLPSLRGRVYSHQSIAQIAKRKAFWPALTLLFLLAATSYGVFVGGHVSYFYEKARDGVEALAVAAGFGVNKIVVDGQTHTSDDEIKSALGAGPTTMMLDFDTEAAKARLEAVPWIRHAQVMRLLPSTLHVVIEERAPFAIWQSNGKTYVVDEAGTVLAPAVREAYADLPFVVGEGAAKNAPELYKVLEPYEDLKQDLLASIRVGDRRWTLKLKSGLDILLPDDNVAEALKTYTNVERNRGLVGENIATVDLRLADRVTFRLRDVKAPRAIAVPVQSEPNDIPTAATKGMAPKNATSKGDT
jgi:cell division protein FtsQ